MKVCRYDEGNTTVFTCPYHGWSYGTDGRLVGVPFFREAYHSKLDRAKWGLVEVAQLCNYKGAILATWDTEAPSFEEYLGDFTRFLDLQLDGWDGREGQAELLCGVQKWRVPCNWKFPAENFSGDTYHNISHRSVDLAGIGPSGSSRRDLGERDVSRKLHVCIPDRGHQTILYVMPRGHRDAGRLPERADRLRVFLALRGRETAAARRGGAARRRARRDLPEYGAAVAPAAHDGGVASARPATRPNAGAISLSIATRRARSRSSCATTTSAIPGPAGMTEQDDMENWNYAHAASRGTIARRHPYSYEQGIDTAVRDYEFQGMRVPGEVIDITEVQSSEQPMRNLYRRWAEFMEADSWDQLATWRSPTRAAAE